MNRRESARFHIHSLCRSEREREKERRTNKTRHYPGFSRDALPSERKSFRSDFLFDGFSSSSSSSSRSRFATAIDSLDVRRGKRGKEKKERTNKSVGEGGRRRRECDERTRHDRGEIGLDSDDVCATPPIDIYPPMGGGRGEG